MILKRGVKIQLLVFALITVLGVSVVAVRYIGIGRGLLGNQYTAYVDLTDSGGVFTNAEVTYRGVTVGRVGPMELTKTGIKVKLLMNSDRKIPWDGTIAVVGNRSAVGEQYIDLQPTKKPGPGGEPAGPYLGDGGRYDTIPADRTRLPVSTAELLRNVDKLISSVNPQHLRVIVDELDKAFNGSAADLQAILDDSDRLLKTAEEAYPDTSELLHNSRTVLDTQRQMGGHIHEFARNLNVLTGQLRRDDPALRATLDATVPASAEATRLIEQLSPTLPVLLANLTTTGQIMTSRIAGIRSLFILYPLTVAGAFTVTPGDGTQHLGLVLNLDSPAPCTTGYEQVKRRWPQFTEKRETPLNLGCKEPKNSDKVIRGARNTPPEARQPYPRVPQGATEGAGFPEGGATGTAGSGEAANAQGSEGTGRPAADKKTGEQGGLTTLSGNSLYVPVSSGSVELAGYDPSTGAVYGPDGKRYLLGYSGGQERLLGDSSWKMLLLGPLAR
ncbi:phospholipid/cholesterol/gamma-HCH transport system substrate-binding protein [Thermomonospora echinospora]|uniref:Phospholipid/cholesterol/gamma-HCH transport system substrate-binding protein n=1 Tax=Thermomonospora echinospora TaxID=1992 RepID=A0A1H5Z6C1_9ACTN|nr:MlaD family protein [Thermomonospora echinospora]SEG32099.1 phospholipid/cholesterol/gamma-HCH transport system substrate-binding protein [Thermomonospora echinospora]